MFTDGAKLTFYETVNLYQIVLGTSQAKTRGERRSEEKGPFMDGN
jgi:hypothetical protein